MLGASIAARRALCAAQRAGFSRPASLTRAIHVSSPVLKKKRGSAYESEDLFDEFEIVDTTAQKPAKTAAAKTSAPSTSKPKGSASNKLSDAQREANFKHIMTYMKPRLGRSPTVQSTLRNSAWLQLLQLATTKQQLEEIVELLPQWKETRRQFNLVFSSAFVRRCKELGAPHLALKVFGDFAKYNVPLDLATGRHLLHSLHKQAPIEDLMSATMLYNLYGLPPVSQDLVSCSIVVGACLRHNTPHSLTIAEALIPNLRALKDSTPVDVKDTYHRENVWVQKAVENINKTLKKADKPAIGPLLVAESTQQATASA